MIITEYKRLMNFSKKMDIFLSKSSFTSPFQEIITPPLCLESFSCWYYFITSKAIEWKMNECNEFYLKLYSIYFIVLYSFYLTENGFKNKEKDEES